MILFDTSVIIDARNTESELHEWAKKQIAKAVAEDGAAINSIVIAEAGVKVEKREHFIRHLENIGLTLLPWPVSAAIPAASAYAVYIECLKSEGKAPKSKIPLGDFLIGAHASAENMTLVTNDPDRVATYFPKVNLITP